LETLSAGSDISFQTTAIQNGKKYMLTSSAYESCIETEFQICKNPDIFEKDEMHFTVEEQRLISRWLKRMDFHKLRIISDDDEYGDFYFEGSFNISKMELAGKVIGFTLTFTSNRPFATGNDVINRCTLNAANQSYSILDSSDEIGYLYLNMEITCNSTGTLRITNNRDNRTTEILNCTKGEVITFDNLIIETSLENHASTLMDDFNFVFPQISNDMDSRKNTYTFSMPCSVVFKYKPIRKVDI
jgi:hypothetical protein